MAKVGAQRAAELTGKSKSTIQRSMNSGKLSYEVDANKRRIIDVSELERVFGLSAPTQNNTTAAASASVEAELKRAADMIEMERMKMKVKALEDQLENATTNLDDMKAQRDQWQKQAQQVLITSQYSQKQAEDLKAELKTREENARKRREQIMAERMQKMKGQNQNKPSEASQEVRQETARRLSEENLTKAKQEKQDAENARAAKSGGFDFQNLWKKIKGEKAA